jgi:hypothetical protein
MMAPQEKAVALAQLQSVEDFVTEIQADGIDPGDLNARLYRAGQSLLLLAGILEVLIRREETC